MNRFHGHLRCEQAADHAIGNAARRQGIALMRGIADGQITVGRHLRQHIRDRNAAHHLRQNRTLREVAGDKIVEPVQGRSGLLGIGRNHQSHIRRVVAFGEDPGITGRRDRPTEMILAHVEIDIDVGQQILGGAVVISQLRIRFQSRPARALRLRSIRTDRDLAAHLVQLALNDQLDTFDARAILDEARRPCLDDHLRSSVGRGVRQFSIEDFALQNERGLQLRKMNGVADRIGEAEMINFRRNPLGIKRDEFGHGVFAHRFRAAHWGADLLPFLRQ